MPFARVGQIVICRSSFFGPCRPRPPAHPRASGRPPPTRDHLGIHGAQVKWALETPLPEAPPTRLLHARTTAPQPLATAGEAPAAPVHINFPFREPLVPPDGVLPSLQESI